MPKTTKRAATKRAARIAKAHATELPKLEVAHRPPTGGKRPARGIRRYPWAVGISLVIIAGLVGVAYFAHLGPFAPAAKPKAKAPAPTAVATVTTTKACLASSVVQQLTDTDPGPTADQFNAIKHTYDKAPDMSIDTGKLYCVGLNTSQGLIIMELHPEIAPNTVNNFVYLAQNQFYDGMKFHRVVAGFVIQTGDPQGTGQGGPGYKFNDEPVKGQYTEGCVAMANSGANTNGSQFFICTADDTKALQPQYNLFGYVVQGMDIAKKIQGPGDNGTNANVTPDTITHVKVVPVSRA